jgi:hypothetical protein
MPLGTCATCRCRGGLAGSAGSGNSQQRTLMPPQAFYLVPVPSDGRPDQGLPPGFPDRPNQDLPWGPARPDQGLPWGPGRPDQGLPPAPVRPDQGLPWGPGRPNNDLPPWYNYGPVDPGWGVPPPGRPSHPLLWLLPWLIKPATAQQGVPPPPTTPKPDPDGNFVPVLVAVGPGNFRWAWLQQVPEPPTPTPTT